ncbi:transglycosylase SLT domain-containing protein [Gordonia sp. SID5947]|uniref:transglycosylase SLT domain-containing protein n=1 Tax=Gordonia sp. SID5947 TaxID=2690315 RepID=UPI00136C0FCA|nr:transglycosylase SLT domain-containing protein [Gordonia sp. SID5947]MYR07359.1 transglycosylase SLT domain-containing protein [Gordonia sp. SID5947]
MFVITKSLKHARSMSRKRFAHAVGAATLAVTAVATVGSISNAEPAQAEQRHSAAAPATEKVKPVADTVAAAKPEAAPAPAPAPAPKPAVAPAPAPAPAPVYANNLDGWIRQSLDILAKNNIPASYDGIMRNIMRESTGNPQAINLYDSNAAAGIPSKGLLQVIDPTFAAYHVEGTKFDVWDPVANIVAACNYAAQTYGSMDNVNSAY